MYPLQYLNDKSSTKRETTEKTLSLTYHTMRYAKSAAYIGMTIGTSFVYSPLSYAQTSADVTDKSTTSATSLPVLTIEEVRDKEPVYAGTDGQVLETNHAGFLGNKDTLETPFSAISYTDKFITDQQAQDITDIISATDASVHSSRTSGESLESYSIRGFTSNSNDATVNGLVGMVPYYRSATEMYERAEVLKGPSAMLNGMAPNGSLGGSINLVTKRADNEPLTRLTTKYLSDSQFGGNIDIGRRYGENQQFGVRFNGAYLDGDTTINAQNNESTLGSLALDWKAERVRLSADFYYTKEQLDGLTRGVSVAPGIDIPSAPDTDTSLNPSWTYSNSETKGAMTRAEFDINDQLTAYASAGISKWDYDGLNVNIANISNSAGNIATTLGATKDDSHRKSLETGLNGHFQTGSVGHQIAANMTRFSEENNLYGIRDFGVTVDTNIYNPVWGAKPALNLDLPFVSTTKNILTSYGLADTLSFAEDKYQLTVGARHQQVKTQSAGATTYDESDISPSAALLIKLTDDLSVYGNYMEALNKGTSTRDNSAINVGETLAPYKTKQKEVGLKLDNGDFTHTVSLYEIKKPESYTDTDTNIFGYYGEQRNRGIEWSFFGTPIDNVRLMGGVTYINAEITAASVSSNEGNQAAGVPDWEAKLGTEWDTPYIQNLTLIAKVNAVSKQYLANDNAQSLAGYSIYGLGARYATVINRLPLTVRANIDNLFDKATWTTASYGDLALVQGRTLTLSAALDF